jgi:hypothetical protein
MVAAPLVVGTVTQRTRFLGSRTALLQAVAEHAVQPLTQHLCARAFAGHARLMPSHPSRPGLRGPTLKAPSQLKLQHQVHDAAGVVLAW